MNRTDVAVAGVTESPRSDATLRSIMEGTAGERGEQFFRSLVQYLAISLQAKSAFAAELNDDRTRVRTLALWIEDRHADNIEFELTGTPCADVVLSGRIQHFSDDVQQTFPTNRIFKTLNARSYLAIPL